MISKKIVILIHALATSKYFMQPIASYLTKHNFEVYNWDYQSRKFTIPEIASQLQDYIILNNLNNYEVNFVTHSMGGIVLRYYAKNYNLNIGNVVMLAPPNNGSEVVDKLKNFYFYKMVFGPAAYSLGTSNDDLVTNLGSVNFNLGVMIGNISYDPLSSIFLPEGNDGKVSIESSKIEGMKEHFVVNSSHITIIFNPNNYKYIYNFLTCGNFSEIS